MAKLIVIKRADFSSNNLGRVYPKSIHHNITTQTTPTGYGSITVSSSLPITTSGYREGTVLTLTAVPTGTHQFLRWSDGETTNPKTYTVGEQDKIFTAYFQ